MKEFEIFDPNKAVLIGSGYGLDEVGARPEINLLRHGAEPDIDYRLRLLAKLRWLNGEGSSMPIGSWDDFHRFDELLKRSEPVEIDGLTYFVVGVDFETGRSRGTVNFMPCRAAEFVPQLSDHEWRGPVVDGPTTAPTNGSKPRPDHVRDAIEANR